MEKSNNAPKDDPPEFLMPYLEQELKKLMEANAPAEEIDMFREMLADMELEKSWAAPFAPTWQNLSLTWPRFAPPNNRQVHEYLAMMERCDLHWQAFWRIYGKDSQLAVPYDGAVFLYNCQSFVEEIDKTNANGPPTEAQFIELRRLAKALLNLRMPFDWPKLNPQPLTDDEIRDLLQSKALIQQTMPPMVPEEKKTKLYPPVRIRVDKEMERVSVMRTLWMMKNHPKMMEPEEAELGISSSSDAPKVEYTGASEQGSQAKRAKLSNADQERFDDQFRTLVVEMNRIKAAKGNDRPTQEQLSQIREAMKMLDLFQSFTDKKLSDMFQHAEGLQDIIRCSTRRKMTDNTQTPDHSQANRMKLSKADQERFDDQYRTLIVEMNRIKAAKGNDRPTQEQLSQIREAMKMLDLFQSFTDKKLSDMFLHAEGLQDIIRCSTKRKVADNEKRDCAKAVLSKADQERFDDQYRTLIVEMNRIKAAKRNDRPDDEQILEIREAMKMLDLFSSFTDKKLSDMFLHAEGLQDIIRCSTKRKVTDMKKENTTKPSKAQLEKEAERLVAMKALAMIQPHSDMMELEAKTAELGLSSFSLPSDVSKVAHTQTPVLSKIEQERFDDQFKTLIVDMNRIKSMKRNDLPDEEQISLIREAMKLVDLFPRLSDEKIGIMFRNAEILHEALRPFGSEVKAPSLAQNPAEDVIRCPAERKFIDNVQRDYQAMVRKWAGFDMPLSFTQNSAEPTMMQMENTAKPSKAQMEKEAERWAMKALAMIQPNSNMMELEARAAELDLSSFSLPSTAPRVACTKTSPMEQVHEDAILMDQTRKTASSQAKRAEAVLSKADQECIDDEPVSFEHIVVIDKKDLDEKERQASAKAKPLTLVGRMYAILIEEADKVVAMKPNGPISDEQIRKYHEVLAPFERDTPVSDEKIRTILQIAVNKEKLGEEKSFVLFKEQLKSIILPNKPVETIYVPSRIVKVGPPPMDITARDSDKQLCDYQAMVRNSAGFGMPLTFTQNSAEPTMMQMENTAKPSKAQMETEAERLVEMKALAMIQPDSDTLGPSSFSQPSDAPKVAHAQTDEQVREDRRKAIKSIIYHDRPGLIQTPDGPKFVPGDTPRPTYQQYLAAVKEMFADGKVVIKMADLTPSSSSQPSDASKVAHTQISPMEQAHEDAHLMDQTRSSQATVLSKADQEFFDDQFKTLMVEINRIKSMERNDLPTQDQLIQIRETMKLLTLFPPLSDQKISDLFRDAESLLDPTLRPKVKASSFPAEPALKDAEVPKDIIRCQAEIDDEPVLFEDIVVDKKDFAEEQRQASAKAKKPLTLEGRMYAILIEKADKVVAMKPNGPISDEQILKYHEVLARFERDTPVSDEKIRTILQIAVNKEKLGAEKSYVLLEEQLESIILPSRIVKDKQLPEKVESTPSQQADPTAKVIDDLKFLPPHIAKKIRRGVPPFISGKRRAVFEIPNHVKEEFLKTHILSAYGQVQQKSEKDYTIVFVWDLDQMTMLSKMEEIAEERPDVDSMSLQGLVHRVLMSVDVADPDEIDVVNIEDDINSNEFHASKLYYLRNLYQAVSEEKKDENSMISHELLDRCGLLKEKVYLNQMASNVQDIQLQRWKEVKKSLDVVNKKSADSTTYKYANVVLSDKSLAQAISEILVSNNAPSVPIDNIFSYRQMSKSLVWSKIQKKYGKCRFFHMTASNQLMILPRDRRDVQMCFINDSSSIDYIYNAQFDSLK